MTLGQALTGMMFLLNMSLVWWEAGALLVLFLVPFVNPASAKIVTVLYFAWAGVEILRMLRTAHMPAAILRFVETWRAHVSAPDKK
jgi:hypothetical protein